jgi:hypothetical protein
MFFSPYPVLWIAFPSTSRMLLSSLSILCASWFVWSAASFLKNLRSARKVGFPIVISLVSPDNPLWMVFGRVASAFLSQLPRPIRELGYYNTHEWSYRDQGQAHERLGPIIMHVSPGTNELFVADAALCDYILSRRKEFVKPVSLLGVFAFSSISQDLLTAAASINLFGKTLASVSDQWKGV